MIDLGPRRDLRLDVLGIDVERLVDLGEDRQRAGKDDGVVAGVPGPGGQDDLVAGPDPQGGHGREQGGGPGGHAQGVLHADMGRVFLLELEDLRCASGRPAERIPRFENIEELPLFDFVVELGPEVPHKEAGLPHRRPPVESEFLAFGGACRHPSRTHENRRGARGADGLQELTAGGRWLTHLTLLSTRKLETKGRIHDRSRLPSANDQPRWRNLDSEPGTRRSQEGCEPTFAHGSAPVRAPPAAQGGQALARLPRGPREAGRFGRGLPAPARPPARPECPGHGRRGTGSRSGISSKARSTPEPRCGRRWPPARRGCSGCRGPRPAPVSTSPRAALPPARPSAAPRPCREIS